MVAVLSPPHTCSTSSPVMHERPLRSNTLFWSFMLFSFRHWARLSGPKLFKRVCLVAPARRHPVQRIGPHSPIWASPSLLGKSSGDAAKCIGMQSSSDVLDFLRAQFTRAVAHQYSVHDVYPFFRFWVRWSARSCSQKSFSAALGGERTRFNSRAHRRAYLHPEKDRLCRVKKLINPPLTR